MKIFLTTMSMGIGGAETHIYELSLSLVERGHDVTIISAGGDFMPQLENGGVKHIYAPMNVRSFKSIAESYRIVCQAVKNEKPDIIHGHARIPALVSYYAAKKYNVPFVTTDHGKFDTSFMTTLMTRWGDKTLAVSEDLKDYLLENYKIKKENVFLTINGINTDVFTPARPKNTALLDEFGIPHDAKVILTVSRLDDTAFRCAEELIDCAEKIYAHDSNTRILIIGNGNLYNAIKEKADEANRKLGFEYIVMPGRRTDIAEICSLCNVFCGVSRAAMEAASSGKPILLAGDGGYFGMLNEKNIALAESYNFTCRGINSFDKEKFINDIAFSLENDDTVKATTTFLRNYVISNLSAKRMTDDTEKVYFEAMKEKGRYNCVLLGYYGFGNMGDDALLMSVINNLRREIPYLRIAVLSHNVKAMREKLHDLKADAFNRFNPVSVSKAFRNAEYLIFGGGTLLQDNTSTKSLLYYLYMIRRAKKHNMKVILYANGIGPIHKDVNKKRLQKILPQISLITARDEQSYEYIKSLCPQANIHLTADEALTTSLGNAENYVSAELSERGFICVSVRKWRNIKDEMYVDYIKTVSEFCQKQGLGILFIVMGKSNDATITEKLVRYVKVPTQVLFTGNEMSGEQLTAVISQAKMTVSVRLHSLIFSACADVPMIGLAYDPKVSAFMRLANLSEDYIINMDKNSNAKLEKALERLYENLTAEKERLAHRMNELRISAQSNAKITAEFIKSEKEDR